MLVIIAGEDQKLLNQKTKEILEKASTSKSVLFVDSPTIDALKESISSQDLFGDTPFFVFRELSDESYEFVFETISKFAESPNHILIQVPKVLKKQKDICKDAEVELFEVKSIAKKEALSFILADAFLRRDKKGSFLALHEELSTKQPEEVQGGLWYQIKTMALIAKGATESDSGIHPFVYKKLKSASKLFSQEEINQMMKELLEMSHLAHRGGLDFPVALELFVLKYSK